MMPRKVVPGGFRGATLAVLLIMAMPARSSAAPSAELVPVAGYQIAIA
jgi:hypothetical protein